MIEKIRLKQAGLIYVSMNILVVIINLLVIFKLMPYTWINGAQTATYAITRHASLKSIQHCVIEFPIILVACEIFRVEWNDTTKKVFSILLWVFVGVNFLSLVMQLQGTLFQKCVMSVIYAVNIIMAIRLAMEKH